MLSPKRNCCGLLLAILAVLMLAFAATPSAVAQTQDDANLAWPAALPHPAHIVVVLEENHGYTQIIGSSQAPYINTLASEGALFTNSHAITHPSEPNYLALFSGSTQGITDDSCPHTFSAANLGSELIAAKDSFTGYAEGLPSTGSTVCTSGEYARKHAPWTDFSNVPSSDSKPFSSFPTTFSSLPTISWVVPDLLDDMHDGTIQQADSWLQTHLQAYVTWAKTNNSLLIVTWDEDQGTTGNRIATIFVGPMVKPGKYAEYITHYNVLRTLEAIYGLPYAGKSASVTTITDVWQ
jgi:acid phosphatase